MKTLRVVTLITLVGFGLACLWIALWYKKRWLSLIWWERGVGPDPTYRDVLKHMWKGRAE